jgi:hypothetical protein
MDRAQSASATRARGWPSVAARVARAMPSAAKPRTASVTRSIGSPVLRTSVATVQDGAARSSRSTAPRACRNDPSKDGCFLREARGCAPRARKRQELASGHASHRGRVGRHTSRPRSMSAWFHAPGARGSSPPPGERGQIRRRDVIGVRSVGDPSDDPAHVRVDSRHRDAERDGSYRGGRVRPDALELLQGSGFGRDRAPEIIDDRASRLGERHGASRIAEPTPRGEDRAPPCLREGRKRRERAQERSIRAHHAGRLRLLQHHLRHEDAVRIPRPAPRIDAAPRDEPLEERLAVAGRGGRRGGLDRRA